MQSEAKTKREAQIAAAAYAVIEEKGYAGASMLSIAKKAKASNETLYNWYGDKLGLFKSLISRNTDEVREVLEKTVQEEVPPLKALEIVSPVLLNMLLGERAIALNRAASADPTGKLGETLAEAGRNTVLPLIGKLLKAAKKDGLINYEKLPDVLNTYSSLLVGDLQIRRATGALPPLKDTEIKKRAQLAMTQFMKLYEI
ncbi:MAG: TetR/AcrR family transcriptional regulator [Pseudomonadota bacterium]